MPSVVGRSTLAGGDAAAPSEIRTAERLQRFQGTTPPVKKVSGIMATFRIPSHMVRSGAALPPRPCGSGRTTPPTGTAWPLD